MSIFLKVKNFCICHGKLITIVISAALSLLFIGNIFIAIFSGGEFAVEADSSSGVKGLMRLYDTHYSKSYFEGDMFVFDKERSSVGLIVKDQAIKDVVKIDKLPASEYGFKVNGTGDIIYDASSIVMTKDIASIDVVSRVYPNIFASLDVTVHGAPDESKLTANYTYEAEEADLYMSGKLLSYEEKSTTPDTNKPFLSSAGDSVDGLSCSGGACLRSFNNNNMRVEFNIVSTQAMEAELVIKFCLRQESKSFGQYYTFTLNGNGYSEVDSQVVPKGTGYFTPYSLQTVTVNLIRGVNVFSFESGSTVGKTSPVNLDAIQVTAQSTVLCGLNDIIGG